MGDDVRTTRALERAVLSIPEDKDLRFRLAWKYGQSDQTIPDAVYHYRVLTNQDPKYDNALNNLAADLDKLGLKIEPVNLWKRASEFENPYPSGNLAIALAKAGFVREAEQYIEALPSEQRNKSRAAEASKYIEDISTKEKTKLEKIYSGAKIRRKYLKCELVANDNKALRNVRHDELIGKWCDASSNILDIKSIEKGGTIRGEYITESKLYSFSGKRIDVLFIISGNQTKKKHYGKIFGLGLAGASESGTWVSAGLLAESFKLRLVQTDEKRLSGYMLESDKYAEVVFEK